MDQLIAHFRINESGEKEIQSVDEHCHNVGEPLGNWITEHLKHVLK